MAQYQVQSHCLQLSWLVLLVCFISSPLATLHHQFNNVISAQGYPHSLESPVNHINQPQFPEALWQFLYDHIHPDSNISSANIDIEQCPNFMGQIYVYHLAIAHFYAPSDLCDAGRMYHEQICSNPNWHGEFAHYDTMFIMMDMEVDVMQGMTIGHALLFFSFTFGDTYFPCALVHWLILGNVPDDDTGMWVVLLKLSSHAHLSLMPILAPY